MSEIKRIVIVGGVAGGASAAARARRLSEKAEIIMFERGEHISFANCGLPYHIGGTIGDRAQLLVQTPESFYKRFRIDVRTHTEVVSIDREKKEVSARNLTSGEVYAESYDSLVLSPGAEPVRPPIPGLDSGFVFTLRNMEDMDAINKHIDINIPSRAVVVGGGYIGLEMVEALHNRGIEVTLVELASQVMVAADPEMTAPIKQELEHNGVVLHLNTSLTGVTEEYERVIAHLSTGKTLRCGLIILAVGVKPETALAREAGLDIGDRGGIKVDEHLRTNDPDIFAVGDAVEVTDLIGDFQALIPLAGPASRQGRTAADIIFGRESEYKKTQGTAICKVFETAVAMTGMNEKNLKKYGIDYEKVYIHPTDHAGYYPGATTISLKLLFDPDNGKILGAQAAGRKGIDKRIDVLATAIRAGMTVFDLEHLELTYAPPYGSAKDPVNYAGFVAANVLKGDARLCHVEDVLDPGDDRFLLDVRTVAEVKSGAIPCSYNIPVDELRERLIEVPHDKGILVYCQAGLRGYLACRILAQNGYECSNFSGGYKTYSAFREVMPEMFQDD